MNMLARAATVAAMFVVAATMLVSVADAQPVTNTEYQLGIGTPEILTNSLPGGGVTSASPAPVRTLSSGPAQAPSGQTAGSPLDGFDPSAYYRAKADFAKERMQWEEIEARRYARFSARMNLGGSGSGSMSQIIEKAMGGCGTQEAASGFWAGLGNRMGRAKECREQQTTARVLMCNMVAMETGEISVMNHCAQMAKNDNQWIGFWTQALRSGVTLAGIHYGAGVLSDMIGLSAFAVDRGFGTADRAIDAGSRDPFIVEPTVIETPPAQIIETPPPVIIDGGGGGG